LSFKAIKTTFATVANFCRYITLNSTFQLQMQENVKANSQYCNFDLQANVSYFTMKLPSQKCSTFNYSTQCTSSPCAGHEGIELGYTSTL